MVIKNIDYYDFEIERLKTSIRRLRAEKRVAILLEREQKAAVESEKASDNNEQHSK